MIFLLKIVSDQKNWSGDSMGWGRVDGHEQGKVVCEVISVRFMFKRTCV